MTYNTSLGSWVYTLQPDGSITANGGMARAVRIGRAPAAPAKPVQTGSSEAAAVGNQNSRPAPTKDCSGVSGKVNGVELKPMKCDDAPSKAAALAPAPNAQPAKPTQVTSGTVAGSKRALDAIADISPEFKKALENASLSLENAKIDPSRVKEPVVREAEKRPARVEAKSSSDNSPSQQAADAPQDPPREITDLDPEDYAKKCRDESFESGLKSLKQDIAAATRGVTLERDPKNKKPVRGLKFYLEKYKLVKRVLKRCAVEVLNRQVIDPIERSGILADIADDPE
ncbi:hypothetical protein [Bradyrhizobium sp. PRIMUS42]|uniref:hypothetical protein n=1 Tax=Bradyrhizobium sp. PRIMUS42 TaxID=2908926 RepID=UPI001FF2604E|nr:hypothetical protein [Bradyrhizobium sp. PRIMUS42]MCJ9732791.1 hypothetical protein [Bradyrhizobium sp. PRIMUS42]